MWIMKGGKRLLWLPPDYQSGKIGISEKKNIAFASLTGQVRFLQMRWLSFPSFSSFILFFCL
jgi:hypothetical protein